MPWLGKLNNCYSKESSVWTLLLVGNTGTVSPPTPHFVLFNSMMNAKLSPRLLWPQQELRLRKKTKNQENLLTLALPNQSNAVIYYITSAFRFSSLTQKEKTRTGQEGAEGAALKIVLHRILCIQGLTPVHVDRVKNVQQEQDFFYFFKKTSRKAYGFFNFFFFFNYEDLPGEVAH